MKTTLPEKSKLHELIIGEITKIIIEAGKDEIAFVILFGSFARGDWVFDRYTEDRILYQYASDYDFLIITRTAKQAQGAHVFDLEKKIVDEVEKRGLISKYQGHRPHYVFESIKRVNDDLKRSQYFFSDIKKEGILLYESGEFELSPPVEVDEKKKKEIATEDYIYWSNSAFGFLRDSMNAFKIEDWNKAAFYLHQATEHLYNCFLLVATGHKPKSHDLEELSQLCATQSNDFLSIFPLATEEQKKAFKLLQKSYISARYNKYFLITKEQLEYLLERVNLLKDLVKRVCVSYIE